MHRRDAVIRGFGSILLASSMLAVACESSGSTLPDPVAVAYCADCSEFSFCPIVIDEALNAGCPEETRAYYACVTENSCQPASCETEWQRRQACFGAEDAGTDGAP